MKKKKNEKWLQKSEIFRFSFIFSFHSFRCDTEISRGRRKRTNAIEAKKEWKHRKLEKTLQKRNEVFLLKTFPIWSEKEERATEIHTNILFECFFFCSNAVPNQNAYTA